MAVEYRGARYCLGREWVSCCGVLGYLNLQIMPWVFCSSLHCTVHAPCCQLQDSKSTALQPRHALPPKTLQRVTPRTNSDKNAGDDLSGASQTIEYA